MFRNLFFAFIEIILAVVVGFSVTLQLGSDPLSTAAGLIVGSFGVLHGVHRLFFSFEIAKSKDFLTTKIQQTDEKLGNKMESDSAKINANLKDISQKIILSTLDRLYNDIDSAFLFDKDTIIAEAKNKLSDLHAKKESSPMEKGRYYNWISDAFSKTKRGDIILAISRMKSTEWEDTPEEKRFVKENIDAGKNGVEIKRIFVSPQDIFNSAKEQAANPLKGSINAGYVFKIHSKTTKNNIVGRFADENRIKQENPRLLEEIGDGFLMFIDGKTNDAVVLIDNFTADDEARGIVIKRDAVISNYRSLFDQLQALSEVF